MSEDEVVKAFSLIMEHRDSDRSSEKLLVEAMRNCDDTKLFAMAYRALDLLRHYLSKETLAYMAEFEVSHQDLVLEIELE